METSHRLDTWILGLMDTRERATTLYTQSIGLKVWKEMNRKKVEEIGPKQPLTHHRIRRSSGMNASIVLGYVTLNPMNNGQKAHGAETQQEPQKWSVCTITTLFSFPSARWPAAPSEQQSWGCEDRPKGTEARAG